VYWFRSTPERYRPARREPASAEAFYGWTGFWKRLCFCRLCFFSLFGACTLPVSFVI